MPGNPLPVLLLLALGQPVPASEPEAVQDRWAFRMGYFQAEIPTPGERLGLTDLSLFHEGPHGFYLDPSLHAALRGQRGGFFTAGLEGGLRIPLTPRLVLDGGLFLGGGGGGSAPVGGGFMLRPHLGLIWEGTDCRLGAGFTHLRFPNGEIRSTQAYLSWERRFDSHRLMGHPQAPALDALPLQFSGDFLELHGTRCTDAAEGSSSMDLLGITWGHPLGAPFFWQVEASSAARGGRGGYMEVLGGLGARMHLGRFALRGSLGAGSGGGGGVATGGGFLFKASGGLQFQATPALHLFAEVARVAAPSASFKAMTISLGAGFTLDSPGAADALPPALSALQWRLSSSLQRYGSAARNAAPSPRPLEQYVFRAECLISDQIYVTGQSGWATGGHAGAWATGLLGLGAQTPAFQGHRLRVELAAGAGGGGGVDSQGGALVQCLGGWLWDFSPSWSVHVMGGRIRAPQGALSSSVLELGLGFRATSPVAFPLARVNSGR